MLQAKKLSSVTSLALIILWLSAPSGALAQQQKIGGAPSPRKNQCCCGETLQSSASGRVPKRRDPEHLC